jgi:hypothetical protein
MFVLLLALLLIAWVVHLRRADVRTRARGGELLVRYVLAGYCGIPMLVVAGILLIHPHESAHILGVEPDHPFGRFFGWAYLGMALAATLTLRFRGTYLIGPAVVWAVFFAGATVVHIDMGGGAGAMGHRGLFFILAAHALVSVLLVAGLWTSGVWRLNR